MFRHSTIVFSTVSARSLGSISASRYTGIPSSLRIRNRQCSPLRTVRRARLLSTLVDDGTAVWKALKKSITRSSSSDKKSLRNSALGLPILNQTNTTMSGHLLLSPVAWNRHRGRSTSKIGDKDENPMRVYMITTTGTTGR